MKSFLGNLLKEKRGLFDVIFGKNKKPEPKNFQSMTLLNGYVPVISATGETIWYNDSIRSIIHCIAENVAKTKPVHIRKIDGKILPQNSQIQNLLQNHPNIYMNSHDFFYKITTQLLIHNNAFVYVDTDSKGNVVGLYPLNAAIISFVQVPESDEIFLKFNFRGGKQKVIPYADIIHIRRHYCENDIFGSYNSSPLVPILLLLETVNQGIINSVNFPAKLRGILTTEQIVKEADQIKARNDFLNSYMALENDGGVAVVDGKFKFDPIELKPVLIDAPQWTLIEEKLFKYYNINRAIVMADYSEQQWNAFYNTVIEPLCLQLSQEFTDKIFTERERGYGNQLFFEQNRLQYASNTTKIALLEKVMPFGMFSINEAREIFNMAPIENGEKYLISLNYVDSKIANEYQINRSRGGVIDETDKRKTTDGLGEGTG